MTFNQLFNIKAALEELGKIENGFAAALHLNKLLAKIETFTKPFETTLKTFQEKAKALPQEAKGDNANG